MTDYEDLIRKADNAVTLKAAEAAATEQEKVNHRRAIEHALAGYYQREVPWLPATYYSHLAATTIKSVNDLIVKGIELELKEQTGRSVSVPTGISALSLDAWQALAGPLLKKVSAEVVEIYSRKRA